MKKKVVPSFRLEWEADEHEYKERSSDWYWAVSIITVSVAIASVIFGNIIFGILVLVAAFSLTVFIDREPRIVKITVTEKGISKGGTMYPYDTLKSFWIETEHSHPKIMLRSERFYLPLIIIPLGEGVDLERLEDVLKEFLEEEYHSTPLLEKFLEYLGF